MLCMNLANLASRKKSHLNRPTLNRAKAHSAGMLPHRHRHDNQLFRFGAGSSKLSTSTSMSLDECFGDSPPQKEKRASSVDSPSSSSATMGPSRAKSARAGVRNGSPIGHSRRPPNPLFRPRKQFRRSASMFENSADVVGQPEPTQASTALQSVMDVDELHQPALPHFFPEGQPDTIPRISKDTLVHILDGKYDGDYDKRMVIDCRFEYEYSGGHITGALNYNDKEALARELFTGTPEKTLLVFHCEYSAHRAPIMARHVRQADRTTNIEQYPKLTYPEVYILDEGYSGFFGEFRDRCYPQSYVEMEAKEHANTCEREMGKLRHRGKFGRAHTYAFGQDSPTAPGRSERSNDTMLLDSSPVPNENHRLYARRMASH